ncbi:MAG: hypothetical protein LBO09_06275 [Candidatus Peribacteria bacterium]|nr:hypothetical protein [Candidatus Peribacteria bacterium]
MKTKELTKLRNELVNKQQEKDLFLKKNEEKLSFAKKYKEAKEIKKLRFYPWYGDRWDWNVNGKLFYVNVPNVSVNYTIKTGKGLFSDNKHQILLCGTNDILTYLVQCLHPYLSHAFEVVFIDELHLCIQMKSKPYNGRHSGNWYEREFDYETVLPEYGVLWDRALNELFVLIE